MRFLTAVPRVQSTSGLEKAEIGEWGTVSLGFSRPRVQVGPVSLGSSGPETAISLGLHFCLRRRQPPAHHAIASRHHMATFAETVAKLRSLFGIESSLSLPA